MIKSNTMTLDYYIQVMKSDGEHYNKKYVWIKLEDLQKLCAECLPKEQQIFGGELLDHIASGYNQAIEDITQAMRQRGLL